MVVISFILLLSVTAYISAGIQYHHYRYNEEGVIVSDVKAYKTSVLFTPAFKSDIHQGTEFSVIGKKNDALHIRLPDNHDCWIQEDAARLLE